MGQPSLPYSATTSDKVAGRYTRFPKLQRAPQCPTCRPLLPQPQRAPQLASERIHNKQLSSSACSLPSETQRNPRGLPRKSKRRRFTFFLEDPLSRIERGDQCLNGSGLTDQEMELNTSLEELAHFSTR